MPSGVSEGDQDFAAAGGEDFRGKELQSGELRGEKKGGGAGMRDDFQAHEHRPIRRNQTVLRADDFEAE